MIRLATSNVRLMTAVHGWSGIVLGLFIYMLAVTGMIAVMADEIGHWASGAAEPTPFSEAVDARVAASAARTPQSYRGQLVLYGAGPDALGVNWSGGERLLMWSIAADGTVKSRREGTPTELGATRNEDALAQFLVDLHVRLQIPEPWGLIFTGMLGLAMMVAAISGLLIHRHILRDIFTLRWGGQARVALRDRHSVAGSWSLPFAFLLAFTGCFFSLAGTLGLPALAAVAFDGNRDAMMATLNGLPASEDSRLAPTGSYDLMIADARRRAGTLPQTIIVDRPGRADAVLTTIHAARAGGIEPVQLVYEAASGRFIGEKPTLGQVSSVGGTLFAIMAPLHYGDFAGLLSKIVWAALGFAIAFVTLSGLRLWLSRREHTSRLERLVSTAAFGLPLAIAAAAAGYFLSRDAGRALYWTPVASLIGAGCAFLVGLSCPRERIASRLSALTGMLLALLPVARMATAGDGWSDASALVVSIDLTLLIVALALLHPYWPKPRAGSKRYPA